MKLKSLGISHFRCFESIEISFEPDVTLVVGINGAGKSALLDAVAIALFDLVSADESNKNTNRKAQGTQLKPSDIRTVSTPDGTRELARDFVHIRATATTEGLTAKKNYGRELEWDSSISFTPPNSFRYNSDRLIGESSLRAYLANLWSIARDEPKARNSFPVAAYYRAARVFSSVSPLGDIFATSFERTAAYESALDAGADYSAMCRWLYLLENEKLRGTRSHIPNSKNIFDTVQEALVQLVDGVEEIGFEGLPPKLMVTSSRSSQHRKLFLDQMSDGYRNLIGLVLDFSRRLVLANPNSEEPLREPAILLIDEIDLHIHVKWQQTIIPKLRRVFPNTQIIATTHSPQVLTSVNTRNIRILDGLVLHAAPSGIFGAESKTALEEVLGVNSRPPEEYVPVVREIRELYEMINSDRLKEAKKAIEELIIKGYETDSAVLEADVILENRIWERGKDL